MTQLPLELTPPEAKKPWRRVRETSKAAYADGRERFTGRRGNVLRWLAAHYNWSQRWPTSAELALQNQHDLGSHVDWTSALLYTRRGLVDLQKVGVVEAVPGGKRACRVSGRVCETWRVRGR